MSEDWYRRGWVEIDYANEEIQILTDQLSDSREAVERLAEFASELADRDEAHKEGMVNNFNRIMELLDELDAVHLSRNENVGEAEMWRHLCHSRAVQLNEAYNTISELRDEVKSLLETIDDLIVR